MTVSKSKRPLFGWSGETVSKDGKSVFKTPMWNDVDNIPDPKARSMDEQVEMRCKTKRLADCELPEGFRLVTKTPRQYWLDQQLRWSFEIAFGEHSFVARYDQQVADDIQMQWAIADFTAELLFKGVSLSQAKKRHETTRYARCQ
jgi:hypothetical protein